MEESDARLKKLLRALDAEDALGMVIRAHIHIESMLIGLVEREIKNPEFMPKGLRYEQRVSLACALGLRGDVHPALRALGEIRNAFGHKPDTRLDRPMVAKLLNAFSQDHKDAIAAFHEDLYSIAESGVKNKRLNEASPREQFISCVLHLYAVLENHLSV